MITTKPKRLIFNSKLKAEKDYWIQKLSGGFGASNLRPDFERPAVPSGMKSVLTLTLPEGVSGTPDESQADSHLSLFATLMAALKVCLHKYTGSDSIVVGSPPYRPEDAPRPAPNVLPVIDKIDDRQTFQAFAGCVRESLSAAYERQSYPYDRLIKDLGLESVEGRFPLFDFALVLTNVHGDVLDVGNDITLVFTHSRETLSGRLEYDGAIFRRESVEQFARHFVNILRAASESPYALIRDLDPLDEEERRRLTADCNQTYTAYPQDRRAHQLFSEQAARTPSATALVCGERRISYGELEARANRLARHLRALGAWPETRVAIYAERSPEMVFGVLATLKAGAAYMPLDTAANPTERVAFMLQDSGARVLLTQRRLLANIPKSDAQVVCLDDERLVAGYPATPPPNEARPDNAAYVIYTSGSTGRPKGVMVEHRGLANMVHTLIREYHVRPDGRVLQFASFGFDASVAEIFTTLCAGAALHLGPQAMTRVAGDVTKVLRGEAITDVTLPPALLAVLDDEDLPELRTIISAGETCPANVAERWGRGRHFINAYGPTEASVCASVLECRGTYHGAVPIGRPISNTRLYVLDASMRVVPPGVRGELYIGGDGLARGYLNRPDLTAERFLPDPFSPEPGARLYRTGDVVRRLADGGLEYVGRADSQVKVRGYRVELGEVEAALLRQAGVREAAAVVEGGRISAFVVRETSAGDDGVGLREALERELPSYMAPWRVVEVSALPLTENGKVNRAALLSLVSGAAGRGGEPETETERAVAAVWGEVLGASGVGRADDFFELGGHSLLATQVISRLRSVLGLELTASDLFEHPALAEFARHIETMRRAALDSQSPVGVSSDGRDEGEL